MLYALVNGYIYGLWLLASLCDVKKRISEGDCQSKYNWKVATLDWLHWLLWYRYYVKAMDYIAPFWWKAMRCAQVQGSGDHMRKLEAEVRGWVARIIAFRLSYLSGGQWLLTTVGTYISGLYKLILNTLSANLYLPALEWIVGQRLTHIKETQQFVNTYICN